KRKGVDERATAAEAVVSDAEQSFGEVTGALADLTARRRELDGTIREQGERLKKIEGELANIAAGLTAAESGRPDVAALPGALEEAQAAVTESEQAAIASEAAHDAARDRHETLRGPLSEAEQKVQRLETEAKTLMKLLAVESKNMWPPIMDNVTVEKGFEAA